MKPEHITDNLNKLLEVLPLTVQEALNTPEKHQDLIEVILDLGRVPEARYPKKVLNLGDKIITRKEIQETVNLIGGFENDNRAGIEQTLHRISAITNRKGEVIGLTCRVGRSVLGTVKMVRDLIESGQSILLMGKPGIGKTTALREIARVMADELKLRVIVIDTSNEIGGDGDIPHPAIGKARRMQVTKPEYQHQVMIEAVENHMPEVILIDEIGTELEASAARTIAERGVQLIATAHGNTIENLIKNPTLSDLIGGIQSVTLGDEEARRRRTQKTVLERSSEPTFTIAVEINNRNLWSVHKDVSRTVDLILRGQKVHPQERKINENGNLEFSEQEYAENSLKKPKYFNSNILAKDKINSQEDSIISKDDIKSFKQYEPKSNNRKHYLNIFSQGIKEQVIEEIIRRNNWSALLVNQLKGADVIISIKNGLAQNQILRKEAKDLKIPIHIIKSDSPHQVQRAIERLLKRNKKERAIQQALLNNSSNEANNSLEALEECRLALEKIVLPLGKPVELLPRSEGIVKLQEELVTRYRLKSDVFGSEGLQRLRVYPP